MDDHKIITKVFGGKNTKVQQILGRGDVNRVYVVEKGVEKFVIRLNDKSDFGRFKKEAWCLEVASKAGIPSPMLIKLGMEEDTCHMVLNFIPGKNGKEIKSDKTNIWLMIGSYAKKINSINTTGFGETMTAPGFFNDSWQRYLDYNIQSLDQNDKALSLGVFTKEMSKKIKEDFANLKNKKFNFGLIHGDLSFANIIVNKDKVTLIDWGVAESTIVPHMEIADLLQNQISDTDAVFDDFIKGYGMTKKEYFSIKLDIKTLTLLQAIDKLRWAIDKSPNKIGEFSKRIKKLI